MCVIEVSDLLQDNSLEDLENLENWIPNSDRHIKVLTTEEVARKRELAFAAK